MGEGTDLFFTNSLFHDHNKKIIIIIGLRVIDLLYQDLPDDPTGRFHDFKKFVKSNFDIFKWIGIWIISAQVILFVLSNTVICNHKINNTLIFNHKLKYISLSTSSQHYKEGMIISQLQVSSALLAMALRALGSNQGYSYDNDGEFLSDRLPLINHHVQAPAYVIGDPPFAAKYDPVKPTAYAWNVKIHFNPSQLFLASFLS